jgi:hypothetical protein
LASDDGDESKRIGALASEDDYFVAITNNFMYRAREVTAWEPHGIVQVCDLGVKIATVLEIIGHFLFKPA